MESSQKKKKVVRLEDLRERGEDKVAGFCDLSVYLLGFTSRCKIHAVHVCMYGWMVNSTTKFW